MNVNVDRNTLLALVLLLAVAISVAAPVWSTYHLAAPDAMAYADTARHIVYGHGAVSGRLQPGHLSIYHHEPRVPGSVARIPMFYNYAWPAAMAPWVAVFGAKDQVPLVAALLWWIVAGMLVFAAARLLGGTLAGWFGVAVFALHPRTIGYALNGLSEPLSQAALLAALWLLLPRDKERWPRYVAAGLIAALAGGIRRTLPVLGLALVVVAAWTDRERRWRKLAFGAGSFVLVSLLLHLARPALFPQPDLSGHRYVPEAAAEQPAPAPDYPWWFTPANNLTHGGLLAFTDLYPGHVLTTDLESPHPAADAAVASVGRKVRLNAEKLGRVFAVGLGGAGLTWLFWLAIFFGPRAGPWRTWAWVMLTLLLATAAMCLPLFVMDRYFDFLLPFAMVLIAGALGMWWTKLSARVSARRALWLPIAAGALLLVSVWPTPWAFFVSPDLADDLTREALRNRAASYEVMVDMLRRTGADDVIATDVPWACAWLGDRSCVLTPRDEGQLDDLRRRARVRWVLLSFGNPVALPYWRQWAEGQTGQAQSPWVFRVGRKLPNGTPLLLFEEKRGPS